MNATTSLRLKNQTALISGGGPIADAIARRFIAEGARAFCFETLDASTPLEGAEDASILVTIATSAHCVAAASDATAAALPLLRRNGGAIVHVAPPMGMERAFGLAAYGAAAAGLRGYTRGSAIELGDDAIRVNLVQPGVLAGIVPDDALPLIPFQRGGDPSRRVGEVADIVNAVLFLASRDAGYVHGAEFVIDGGLSQCRNSSASKAWDSGGSGWGV